MIDYNYNGETLEPQIIDIPGKNEKQGKEYKITTNYMIFPNGKLKMNTPIGGWQ